MPSRKLHLRLWHPAKRKRGVLILPDGNVLPSHLHTAASVDLQTDDAICEFGRGVRKVHNLCAIELRNDVSAVHGHFSSFQSPGFSACSPSGAGCATQPRPPLSYRPPVCLPMFGSTSTCIPSMSGPCCGSIPVILA